jgi:hypothetical protein
MTNKRREITAEKLATKQFWRGRSLVERLQHLTTIVIPHPQFSRAVAEIERRRSRVQIQGKGAAFGVVAETGGGKTTLAKVVKALYPDIETEELSIRKTVCFSVPPRPSSSAMSSAVLEALGDPCCDKGKSDTLKKRVINLLKECKTEIILMDNTHDIPERRALKGVREVGNWVRDIIDAVPALFVSLGAKQGLDVFKANSQARRRSPATVRIDYFNCKTDAGVSRMRRFLFELDIQLPLAEMSNLSDFETTKRIWIATNGIPDYITNLMTEAIEIAVRDHREKISWEDLAKALNSLFEDNTPSELNPFTLSTANLRLLDKEGEPFEEWLEDGYE